ncbi:MAG: DUF2252 domain-containing protein [Actinomycetota bacterium]
MTPEERVVIGKDARNAAPRSAHADWTPAVDRPDPITTLRAQETNRVPELLPLRYQRMLASPFTFYRGAAAVMAADLSGTPDSGLPVQCCGDAHLANFGAFASPERRMVFDINDFDETLPGPWEWDVKRLAASMTIAAQDRAFTEAEMTATTLATVAGYREAMRQFAGMRNLDVWYAQRDAPAIVEQLQAEVSAAAARRVERRVAKAEGKNSLRAFERLTERVDGELRIANDPPVVMRMADILGDRSDFDLTAQIARWIRMYGRSLQRDRRHLLESYRVVDIARKVVGVGSVGTRCWIALLLGRDDTDPLFLQLKQASASVLEAQVGRSTFANSGQRVVEGQRIMQTASDIFLGWDRIQNAAGEEHDFYIRQLWDGKFSVDLETIEPPALRVYGGLCGWTLARAHARSGDRIAIASYLGSGDRFDRAILDFSVAYAAQNERDYAAACAARDEGRLPVESGS